MTTFMHCLPKTKKTKHLIFILHIFEHTCKFTKTELVNDSY